MKWLVSVQEMFWEIISAENLKYMYVTNEQIDVEHAEDRKQRRETSTAAVRTDWMSLQSA